jgi:hypothetical protein
MPGNMGAANTTIVSSASDFRDLASAIGAVSSLRTSYQLRLTPRENA